MEPQACTEINCNRKHYVDPDGNLETNRMGKATRIERLQEPNAGTLTGILTVTLSSRVFFEEVQPLNP